MPTITKSQREPTSVISVKMPETLEETVGRRRQQTFGHLSSWRSDAAKPALVQTVERSRLRRCPAHSVKSGNIPRLEATDEAAATDTGCRPVEKTTIDLDDRDRWSARRR